MDHDASIGAPETGQGIQSVDLSYRVPPWRQELLTPIFLHFATDLSNSDRTIWKKMTVTVAIKREKISHLRGSNSLPYAY
jgi:hypothetical protein